MGSESIRGFLEALDRVRESFICCVCGELCVKPVTVSECLHLMCSHHLDNRDTCPQCLTSLEGCTFYKDETLESCIESTKVLDELFESERKEISKEDETPAKRGKYEKSKNKKKDSIEQKEGGNETEILESKKKNVTKRRKENTEKRKLNNKKSDGNRNEILGSPEIRTERKLNRDEKNKAKKHPKEQKSDQIDVLKSEEDGSKEKRINEKSKAKRTLSREQKSDLIEVLESEEDDTKEKRINEKSKAKILREQKSDQIDVLESEGESTKEKSKTKKKDTIEQKRNIKGETMLHKACISKNLKQVKELINQGACVNTKDNAGWTPLHEVVQNGRIDIVQVLLDNNALVNVPGPANETPLHEAIRYKHSEIAELLVRYGADVNARNCKGETPFELADEDTKVLLNAAQDNIVQSQTANVTLMSVTLSEIEFDDIRIYNASQFKTVANKLKSLLKQHDNLNLETKLTNKVTHVIVDTIDDVCDSSLEVLQAIVFGIWVIDSTWVTKSTAETLESFDKYEVKGVGAITYDGPKKSRFNKYKQLPGLFNGCHFYLHNFHGDHEISKNLVLTKAILTKLIATADGTVLRRVPNPESIPESEKVVPYHARKDGLLAQCSHYIIYKDNYEPKYNMKHLKALSIGWLIECIEKYELCEPW